MKDRLKVGNRVSCLIEQSEGNFIVVSCRTGGHCYRGVLINEKNSIVRRTILPDHFPTKTILDKETAESFCTEIANRELTKSSTKTRSKTSKQSCIILDDYDLGHLDNSEDSTPLGKSPIDSIRGLVESIDTSKVLSLQQIAGCISVVTNSKPKTTNQSRPVNLKTIPSAKLSDDPRNPVIKTESDLKTSKNDITSIEIDSRFSFLDSGTRVFKSPVKVLNRQSSVHSCFDFSALSTKEEQYRLLTSETPDTNGKSKRITSPKISSVRKRKLDRPVKINLIKDDPVLETKINLLSSKIKQDETPKLEPTKETVKNINDREVVEHSEEINRKKRRKRKPLLLTKKKRIISNLSHNQSNKIEQNCEETSTKTLHRVNKPKQTRRVDPILIALKNIKKYDSLRKKRNLNNSVFNSERLKVPSLRKARNNRRNALKKRLLSQPHSEDETDSKPDEKKLQSRVSMSSSGDDKSWKVIKTERKPQRCLLDKPAEDRVKTNEMQPSSCDKNYSFTQAGNSKTNKITENNLKTVFLQKPAEPSTQNKPFSLVNRECFTSSHLQAKIENISPELDLLCHEQSFVKKDVEAKATIEELKPRKIRRKPIHVFKSLPNPAEEKRKQEEQLQKQDEQKGSYTILPSSKGTNKRKEVLPKGHNTRYRGTKSVIPSLNLSPNRFKKAKHGLNTNVSEGTTKLSPRVSDYSSSTLLIDNNKEKTTRSKRTSLTESDITDTTPESLHSDDDISESKEKKSASVKRKKRSQLLDMFENLKPLTRDNNEVRIGDVVWGKCHGHGWWPGFVLSYDKCTENFEYNERKVNVSWLNSNTQSVMVLRDLNLFLPFFRKRFNNSKKGMYAKAVSDAQNLCKIKYGVL